MAAKTPEFDLRDRAIFSTIKTSSQALTSTFADIVSWNAAEIDTLSGFNATTGVYTVPKTAKYRISYQGTHDPNSATGYMRVRIVKNGSDLASRTIFPSDNAYQTLVVEKLASLTAGDTIKIQAQNDSNTGAVIGSSGDNVVFSIEESILAS